MLVLNRDRRYADLLWGDAEGENDYRWLAVQLRPQGILPRTFRMDGYRARGYYEQDLHDIFRRYIPRSEIEALHAEVKRERLAG